MTVMVGHTPCVEVKRIGQMRGKTGIQQPIFLDRISRPLPEWLQFAAIGRSGRSGRRAFASGLPQTSRLCVSPCGQKTAAMRILPVGSD
jgi:hypothetical protein